MEEITSDTNGGYNKRPLWQWIVIYVILAVVIYGAIYYFFLNKNSTYNSSKSSIQYSSPSPIPTSSTSAMSQEITLTLKPVNNSNQVGTATLAFENGKLKVTINLSGYTKDVTQPAHIHMGECPGVGSVKYPVTPVVNGISVTILAVTLENLKKELPLAINVHKSAAEVSIYTSCGPLTIQ